MKPTTRSLLAALLGVVLCGPAGGDDTDIYTNHIVPPTSLPLVMFSLDLGSGIEGTYAGCVKTGTGASMCPAAKFFYDRCPTCRTARWPAADKPFTRNDAIRYAIRTVMLENGGMKVGLMLPHKHQPKCIGNSALNRCSNGGYIARGFKVADSVAVPFTSPPQILPGPNTSELLGILDSIPIATGLPDHPYQGKELFFEFFRYLTGQDVYNAHNGWEDFGTDSLQNANADSTAMDWDASIEDPLGARYLSPLTADLTCSKIFTVNFLLNPSRQDSDSDVALDSEASGGLVGLDLGKNGELDDVIGYLNDVDLARDSAPFGSVLPIQGKQNVTSYFFNVPTPINSDPPQFDKSSLDYAQAGGTNRPMPLNDDPELLVSNLGSVISQILSVSTTFVAASVPVNVFNRSQTLDSVYTALFQSDSTGKPFWPGNLKKLRLQATAVGCPPSAPGCQAEFSVNLLDALGLNAIASDGRIKNEALTFWTDPEGISADPTKGVIAGRDGRHVDKGGAGQKIPGVVSGLPGSSNSDAGARQLYTYPGSGSTLTPLNANAGTAALVQPALGVATPTLSLNLLLCIRGFDCLDQDGDLVTNEVKPWLMGDPLHSRPLPINYGAINGHTADNPAIYVAMGTNQGFLHFIRNTGAGSPGAELGSESWAFMPLESFAIQERLALNNPLSTRMYGVDGAPASYVKDVDADGNIEAANGDRVYLYFGQRRGGRGYYALDVTDPDNPRFLWQVKPTLAPALTTSLACRSSITAGTATSSNSPCALEYKLLGCSGDFCELGYAFPQPRVGNVQVGVDDAGRPVTRAAVFFAGGYDDNKDYAKALIPLLSGALPSPGSIGSNDTHGMAVYVVDAETGALIWKAVKGSSTGPTADARVYTHAQMLDSIPSTLTIVDTNGDGAIDRFVVGDTGGNVWRGDLGGDADGGSSPSLAQITDDWKITLLAKLGRHAGSGKAQDRRFFHEADYILSSDAGGPFDAVVLGSGDREDPMDYGRVTDASGIATLPSNALFVLKDRRVTTYSASDSDASTILTPATLADVTGNCLQAGASSTCNPDLTKGWYIRLAQASGEKLLSSPLTAAYRVYFTTYLPKPINDTTSCAPSEGTGRFYAVDLKNGTAVFNFNTADGSNSLVGANTAADRSELLSSSGIPSDVVFVNLAAGGGAEAKCILTSDLACRDVPGATRFRTHWRRLE